MSDSSRRPAKPPHGQESGHGLVMPAEYLAMLSRDGHHNVQAFRYDSAQLFRSTDLRGKRILEIGSGRGLLAMLMGLQGAARVVSMEPEMVGATSGVIAAQQERIETLGLINVEVLPADFNTWEDRGEQFDLILSRASINHLYASDKHALHHRETFENYVRMARKIHSLLAPGGVFIATDACRYGLFSALRVVGIRRPWRWKRSGVNWRHHQNPGTWKRILRDAGFAVVTVDFPVPYQLRFASALVNTAVANFVLKGSFILRAERT